MGYYYMNSYVTLQIFIEISVKIGDLGCRSSSSNYLL